MNRRQLITGIGLGSVLSLAGCIDEAEAPSQSDATDETETDDALYTVSVEVTDESRAEELPLSLTWDIGREEITEEDPFTIEFILANEGTEPLKVFSGAPWPFEVIWMDHGGSDDQSVTLWTDAYEESSHVNTEGRKAVEVENIGLQETLPAGESVTETYELYHDTPNLEEGVYQFEIEPRVEINDNSESIAFAFEFRLTS